MARYSTGARSIPTSIRSASLVLWVGVHSSSLGLRTLGSTRPWSPTDGSIAATGDGNYGAVHDIVNKMEGYVDGQVHVNGVENFWCLLKRTLKGTYVAVEPYHLQAYVDEQVFRFNNRATKDNPLNDGDRFMLALSQIVGKRLTYAELTGKTSERPL